MPRVSGTLAGVPDVIHLDHAASTPVRPEVLDQFTEVLGRLAGNPMSAHVPGREARTVLEEARERLAAALGRSPHEVVLTSGATEADQLAVVGLARAAAAAGRRHVVCSAVEHAAVRDALSWLVARGEVEVTLVAPGRVAPVDPDAVLGAVRGDTGLAIVTAADGEVGVVQDAAVAEPLLARGVPVHRDAAQAVATGVVPASGSLAVSGHKVGAPAGIGAAVLPRGWPVEPLVPGPGQERGLRSGTPPAALASALAHAVELAVAGAAAHAARSRDLTKELVAGLETVEGLTVTLPAADDPVRLATHVHATVAGVAGEALVTALDAVGVAVSGGTACATGSAVPSPVLAAYGITADAALRCSVGWSTTRDDVADATDRVGAVVGRLRAAGGGFL